MSGIADSLEEQLNIVFIGFNPSIRSGELGHNYAHPGNRFWKILHGAGLTARKYEPWEDRDLLKTGIGFTNIVSRPTRAATDITKEEYAEGRIILKGKLERYRPKIACYVGKGVYQQFTKQKQIAWGIQESSVVDGVSDFVAPSSSGLVRMKIDEIITIYRDLHLYL
ncbi:mismatch-specific DNA-glycosylase [Bacillus sp. 2205SS5-2]|uniref:mismatch-specific DNA-glycosylase n=1 Tax=Bacillus sp. 2205SS5-2 TaxID=3109031 RepID=UPI003007ED52